MHRDQSNADGDLPLQVTRQIDALCDEFEAALRASADALLEPYLDRVDPRWRARLLAEITPLALEHLREAGVIDAEGELLVKNPSLRNEIKDLIANDAVTVSTERFDGTVRRANGLTIRCPYCQDAMELIVDASLVEIKCENCGGTFSLVNDDLDTHDAPALTRIAHFEVVERLGMGEFGTVWKARDTLLERTVAVKIPRDEKLDPLSIEKFMREARAAAQLHHPNIIRTHEVGREKGTLYIVNEYIRGAPLSMVIADHRLGVHESVLILAKLASALEHAHTTGVIHRDIKPSNVLIDIHGEPYLMDFGLAKRSENEITITTEGAILGTPAYMSPEQARGESHRVDGRSDIYSLGVILFQLLTGDLPFRGSIQMLLQKVINDDPPGPRWLDGRVPRDVDTICLKCMEKDRLRRYTTAGDLEADLRRFLAGQPIVARRIGTIGRSLKLARRNPTVAALLAATITTLLVATVVSSYLSWQSTERLYDSLLQEIQLTREVRKEGYGEKVRDLVKQARSLLTPRVDNDELRRQLVPTMGDFVAYSPKVITPAGGEVTALCLGNHDEQVFVGLSGGEILVYDTAGEVNEQLQPSNRQVVSMAIDPHGDQLVSADKAGTIHVLQRAKQKWEKKRSFTIGDAPHWIVLSRHGERAAFLKDDLLEVWDVPTGKKLHTLPTESDWEMQNGAFDTSLERLVSGYTIERADRVGWALWELDSGERSNYVDMPTFGSTFVNDIALSERDDRIAIGFDEALLVYKLESGDEEQTRLTGFDSTKAVAFSPTNPCLAALNIRGRISIWNSATNRQLATLYHPASKLSLNCLSFSLDGKRLAASNADSVQIWDLTSADEKTVLAGHNGAIPAAAFHPQKWMLATGGKDDVVRFWDPSTGQLIDSVELGEGVQTLAFSPDGRLLAVGCTGKQGSPHLRLIDVELVKVIFEAKPAMGGVNSLAWAENADGKYLAGCGDDGAALWRVHQDPTPRIETVVEIDGSWCLATALNSEARLMVWVDKEQQLKAWNVASRREIPLHAPDMRHGWHGLTFLPDGKSIIYVAGSGVVETWNIDEDCHVDLLGKQGTFNAPQLALSSDGKWLAALTQEDTVSVWYRPKGEHVFSMRPETAAVWSLAWDPSGEHLAVGQSDGGLAVWHVPKIQEKLAESGLEWQDHD